jgi:hypothetical protein
MAGGQRSVLRDGIIAGVIGAAVVAVWFLLFDFARGKPLFTPALLGAAVFYGANDPTGLEIAAGPIIGYTVIHGLAFIAFGIVAASLIVAAEREPAIFVAFVILFAAFEALFFGAAGVLGQSMIGALVWWAILVGNLLASIAMLWYFFAGHRALSGMLVGSRAAPVVRQGIIAGLIGAAAVAVWFLAVDFAQGEPLRTPRLLGTALLGRASGAEAVFVYTLLHGMAFIVLGVIAAALVEAAERQPMFIFGLVIFFTSFEIFFFGLVVIVASWVLDQIAGWTILVGNLLAAGSMLWYFMASHRSLARNISRAWIQDEA